MINCQECSKKISNWMTNLLESSRIHQNVLNNCLHSFCLHCKLVSTSLLQDGHRHDDPCRQLTNKHCNKFPFDFSVPTRASLQFTHLKFLDSLCNTQPKFLTDGRTINRLQSRHVLSLLPLVGSETKLSESDFQLQWKRLQLNVALGLV